MSSKTNIADEYAEIAARQAEIKREEDKAKYGEIPKAWPMYAHSDSQAPEEDQPTMYGVISYCGPDIGPPLRIITPSDFTIRTGYIAPDDDCA